MIDTGRVISMQDEITQLRIKILELKAEVALARKSGRQDAIDRVLLSISRETKSGDDYVMCTELMRWCLELKEMYRAT